MGILKIIRRVAVTEDNMDVVRSLPCFRIVNGYGEIILDSLKMTVCCRNVANIGDTIVEYENHQWEVKHKNQFI